MAMKCEYYCYKNTRSSLNSINHNLKKIKLVVFDMDGVLLDTVSSWRYVHTYFGTCNDNSVDDYLKGKIDDLEFIRRDVSLWKIDNKAVKMQKIVDILSDIHVMKGAEECMIFLKKHKIKTAIVSAGLDFLAEKVGKKLDFDYVFANGIKTDENGFILEEGILKVQLMYKDKNIIHLSKILDITSDNIVSVGNSCFDIPMFRESGLGIAFNPEDECTKDAAEVVINEKDLSKIISYLEPFV